MKLNLGCGYRRMEGWVNVDKFEACQPDLVLDLEKTPWPFEDDSVDEVMLIHVLEHIGASTDAFLGFIKELHRVCRHGAQIRIHVPHPRHDDFLNDPTHVRVITPEVMTLFSKRENLIWQQNGAANTLLALYLGVDFEVRHYELVLDVQAGQALESGQVSDARMRELARSQNNVIREYAITLEVLKA